MIHFLLARSLLRDTSLPSRAFLETRLKALLNLNSFHDVGQGDALPTLNPVDEADGVDPQRDRQGADSDTDHEDCRVIDSDNDGSEDDESEEEDSDDEDGNKKKERKWAPTPRSCYDSDNTEWLVS